MWDLGLRPDSMISTTADSFELERININAPPNFRC